MGMSSGLAAGLRFPLAKVEKDLSSAVGSLFRTVDDGPTGLAWKMLKYSGIRI